MPFVPVPLTAMVEVRMLWDGQKVENTLYFRSAAAWTVASLTTLNNNVLAWWSEFVAPLTSASVSVTEIACTNLETAESSQVTLPPADLLTGSVSAESMPNNVSLAISFRTALRGRSFRGRNFFVGMTIDQVLQNTVTAEVADSLKDAWNALHDVASDSSASWVVVSRFHGVNPTTGKPIPRSEGVVTQVNSVIIVDRTVDSMRRRLPGRGT